MHGAGRVQRTRRRGQPEGRRREQQQPPPDSGARTEHQQRDDRGGDDVPLVQEETDERRRPPRPPWPSPPAGRAGRRGRWCSPSSAGGWTCPPAPATSVRDRQHDEGAAQRPRAEHAPRARARGLELAGRRMQERAPRHHHDGPLAHAERQEDGHKGHRQHHRRVGDAGQTERDPRGQRVAPSSAEDRDRAQGGAGDQQERTQRVGGQLRRLEQHHGHEGGGDQGRQRGGQGPPRQQEHARRDDDGQREVEVPLVEHESGHVASPHQREELDERIREQARGLREVLLVHEGAVPERPAPGHEHGERLVDEVGAAEQSPPGERRTRRREKRRPPRSRRRCR